MSVKTVLFDLDGTLLPMDQEVFIKAYFKGLSAYLAPYGYEPKALINAVWAGTAAMIGNKGDKTNEEIFWETFAGIYGEKAREDEPKFEGFYKNEFDKVKEVCGFRADSARLVRKLKAKGIGVVLATNPIFPAIATQSRIRWAGLEPQDFDFYTTYENVCHSKPNPEYYMDIVKRLDLEPQECLMVGNDVGDDMVARSLGMQVFLLTDDLINKTDEDISVYPNGGFDALMEFIEKTVI